MHKTTIYLPEEMLRAIKNEAQLQNCSDASLIRSALEKEFGHLMRRPKPTPGILGADSPQTDSSNLEDLMEGFGES